MQKQFVGLLFLSLFAVQSFAAITSTGVEKIAPSHSLGFSLCGLCTQFMGSSINQLLNAVLQVGVLGGCQELCAAAFPSKDTEQKICDLLCSGVGVYAFVKLLDKFGKDIDTIYFCELLHSCPVQDGGKVQMDSLVVSPASGKRGSTFTISAAFTVLNATGTGELAMDIIPPRDMPFGDGEIYTGFKPGQYGVKFNLPTEPTEDESFAPGSYKVQFVLCEGQCGAPYPHTALLTTGLGNFTITE